MALYPYSCCLLHMIVYQSVMYVKPFVKDKGNPPPNQGGFFLQEFPPPFFSDGFPYNFSIFYCVIYKTKFSFQVKWFSYEGFFHKNMSQTLEAEWRAQPSPTWLRYVFGRVADARLEHAGSGSASASRASQDVLNASPLMRWSRVWGMATGSHDTLEHKLKYWDSMNLIHQHLTGL